MAIKPILFNTEMVRAILDGRKSMTRRVAKPQPEGAHAILDCDEDMRTFDLLCGNGFYGGFAADWAVTVKAPYWPEDTMYVRETWFQFPNGGYAYAADSNERSERIRKELGYKWHPSIHMPKEAARLFLRVKNVTVERLQDITPEQCIAEGVGDGTMLEDMGGSFVNGMFADVWDSTVKKADLPRYGWDANPWVWVIEFERISKEEALENA